MEKVIIAFLRPNEDVDETIINTQIKDIKEAGGDIVFMSPDELRSIHEEYMIPIRSNWVGFWRDIHKLLDKLKS